MSKYIKLEDALKAVRDNTMPLDCWHIDRMRAIRDLPTIEVSEDCISRKGLIDSFLADNECKREEAKACLCKLDFMLELIEDAPSVTTEQSSIVHCKDCKWWTKQSNSIQGRCELGGILYPTGEWFCANGERIEE